MPLRLIPVLCILLLAGCASSEPQNASYAPLAAAPAVLPAPPQQPAVHEQAGQVPSTMPASVPAQPALYDQTGQFSPNTPATPAAAMQPSPGCSTVDGVTLCDVPADASTEDTGANASRTDDADNTN